jgi:hypothetical protein
MITLDDFIKNYEEKQIDFDKAFGSQCVDVFRQYVKEVLGIKEHTGVVEGAKDLYLKYDDMKLMQKYFQKIYTPRKGDVVIFNKTPTNKYGHVAIVIYATRKTLVVFEQNGFDQKKGSYINIRTFENVLGFLRGKK